MSHTYFITDGWWLTCFERWNRYWVSCHFFPCNFPSEIWSLLWNNLFSDLSALIWDGADHQGSHWQCEGFQERSLCLFSIIPCTWHTQFHKNKFALLIGIFWRKLLLKTRNAFTFCPLFKILRMVWLWCAWNCLILWGCGPLLSGCPSTHRGRSSYCHFWRLYPAMSQWSESRLLFLKSDILKNPPNKWLSQLLKDL